MFKCEVNLMNQSWDEENGAGLDLVDQGIVNVITATSLSSLLKKVNNLGYDLKDFKPFDDSLHWNYVKSGQLIDVYLYFKEVTSTKIKPETLIK